MANGWFWKSSNLWKRLSLNKLLCNLIDKPHDRYLSANNKHMYKKLLRLTHLY